MTDPKRGLLRKQVSLSYIEQSLKIIPQPPQQAPVTIYRGPKAGDVNLSKADLEIADRLEKLRKKNVELPTEEEMASRLAQLKGLPADHYTKPTSVTYQPPDNRSNVEKSEGLLKQMMEEVALDTKMPKPEDEFEARLARLRGTDAKPPPCLHDSHLKETNIPPSEGETQPLDYDQVAELVKEAEKEVSEARASFESLTKDRELREALVETSKKGEKSRHRSTSSGEKFSPSESSDSEGKPKRKRGESQKEKEEVNRIVHLYTKKAREKKEKRRRRLLKKKDKLSGSESSDESDTSSSDLLVSTSESEKLSDSD